MTTRSNPDRDQKLDQVNVIRDKIDAIKLSDPDLTDLLKRLVDLVEDAIKALNPELPE